MQGQFGALRMKQVEEQQQDGNRGEGENAGELLALPTCALGAHRRGFAAKFPGVPPAI